MPENWEKCLLANPRLRELSPKYLWRIINLFQMMNEMDIDGIIDFLVKDDNQKKSNRHNKKVNNSGDESKNDDEVLPNLVKMESNSGEIEHEKEEREKEAVSPLSSPLPFHWLHEDILSA